MKKVNILKRFMSYFIVFAILLSFVSANAYDSVWDEFAKYGKYKENSAVTVSFEIFGGGTATENTPLIDLSGTEISMKINSVIKKDGMAYQGDGSLKIIFPDGIGIAPLSFDVWLDLDVSSADDFKYRVILKPTDDIMTQVFGDTYMYIDYGEDSNYREAMLKLMGVWERLSFVYGSDVFFDDDEVKETVYTMMDPIKPVYSDGEYIFNVSVKDVQEIILNNRHDVNKFLVLLAKRINPTEVVTDEDLEEVYNFIESLGIFDILGDKNYITLNIKPNSDNVVDYDMSGDINIEFNIYDMIKALDKDVDYDVVDKAEGEFKLNLKFIGNSKKLSDDYQVDFPEITSDNSINLLHNLPDETFIGDTEESFDDADVNIFINGSKVQLSNSPVLVEDRTFVPLRELSNMFGITDENICYDDETEKITIKFAETELIMRIGSTEAEINGEKTYFDVPLFTLNDRTYIPVRFVSEMFGKSVEYECRQTGGVEILNVFICDI